MPRQYGHYHSVSEFIRKCIPKSGNIEYGSLFVFDVIDGLKRLDRIQQENFSVTLPFDVDGIRVVHNGVVLCKILPRQKWLMIIFDGEGVSKTFDGAVKRGLAVDVTGPSYRSWRVLPEGLGVIWNFIEGLPQIPLEEMEENAKHPRAFPGLARQLALEAFFANGSICPGHRRKKHKINFTRGERIEFDHILPYSQGGASSDWNIQVLCQECNRLKRARCD